MKTATILLTTQGSTYAAAVLLAAERQGIHIDAVIAERVRPWQKLRARLKRYGWGAVMLRAAEIVIFSAYDRWRGRRDREPVETVCASFGIPFERVERLSDRRALALIQDRGPSLGILGGTGKLDKSVVHSFAHGLLNAHHGILPKYRGNFCNRWALLNDDICGFSVYFVDEGLDTGPVVGVQAVARSPGEWPWDLEARVTEMAAEAVVTAARNVLRGQTEPEPQIPNGGKLFGLMPVSTLLQLYATLLGERRRAGNAKVASQRR